MNNDSVFAREMTAVICHHCHRFARSGHGHSCDHVGASDRRKVKLLYNFICIGVHREKEGFFLLFPRLGTRSFKAGNWEFAGCKIPQKIKC